MALGIVNDEDFFKEINQVDTPVQKAEIIDMPSRGRKTGDNNVPESLRKIIGENAIEEGNSATRELTRQFGISDSSMSAYKNGATSTSSYNTPNSELKQTIDKTTNRIVARAKSRILKSIANITDEKLAAAKVTDLSTIARNLGAVVKQMEPEKPPVQAGNGPTFVFYTPPQKKEESYDVIDLKEG